MALVRDLANPRADLSDPYFPFARHMDWYEGHSWSTGLLSRTSDGGMVNWGKYQEVSACAASWPVLLGAVWPQASSGKLTWVAHPNLLGKRIPGQACRGL